MNDILNELKQVLACAQGDSVQRKFIERIVQEHEPKPTNAFAKYIHQSLAALRDWCVVNAKGAADWEIASKLIALKNSLTKTEHEPKPTMTPEQALFKILDHHHPGILCEECHEASKIISTALSRPVLTREMVGKAFIEAGAKNPGNRWHVSIEEGVTDALVGTPLPEAHPRTVSEAEIDWIVSKNYRQWDSRYKKLICEAFALAGVKIK